MYWNLYIPYRDRGSVGCNDQLSPPPRLIIDSILLKHIKEDRRSTESPHNDSLNDESSDRLWAQTYPQAYRRNSLPGTSETFHFDTEVAQHGRWL